MKCKCFESEKYQTPGFTMSVPSSSTCRYVAEAHFPPRYPAVQMVISSSTLFRDAGM